MILDVAKSAILADATVPDATLSPFSAVIFAPEKEYFNASYVDMSYPYLSINNQPLVSSENTKPNPALSVATVKSDVAPIMGLPFLPIVKLLESNVALRSINLISSPALGDAGSVAVTAPPDVLTKYPLPADALKLLLYALPMFHVIPNPLAVPEFVIVAPESIVSVEPD